jgi:hypothetical protein
LFTAILLSPYQLIRRVTNSPAIIKLGFVRWPTVVISIEELQRQVDVPTLPVTEIENLY